ncbi:MAG: tetratricopeptide repeat protein, partial [Phycisphaerae bacterium]
ARPAGDRGGGRGQPSDRVAARGGGAADVAPPDAALRDYLTGNALLNRGLFEEAAAEYRKFLDAHRDHANAPLAAYGLGVSLFRLGRYDDAVAALKQVLSDAAFVYAAEAASIVGRCHLAKGRYADAAAWFETVVARHGDHALADAAAAGSAEALYLDGRYDDAARRCADFVARWPKSPHRVRAEFFWGLSDMARGQYGNGAMHFTVVVDRSRGDSLGDRAALLLAECHLRDGAWANAARGYRNVLRQDGDRFAADAMFGLATALSAQGKHQDAGATLDELLDRFPDGSLAPVARLHRGRVWFRLGRFDKAYAQFDRVAGSGHETVEHADEAAYWMAKCRLRQGTFGEAADGLGRAVKRFPDSALLPEMYYDRAVALAQSGDLDGAVAALDAYLSRFPDHAMAADARHLIAMTLHRQRKFEQSQTHCRAFLDRFGAHALASSVAFLSAENDFLAGRYAASAAAYRRFVQAYPRDGQTQKARFRLGIALYRMDEFDDALPLLTEAADAARGDDVFRPALRALGDIEFQRGRWQQAARHLGDYVSTGLDAPSADDALLKLGMAEQRRNRHEDALEAFDALIDRFEKSPHRLHAMFERGQALVALGRLDDATDAFKQVVERGDDSRFAAPALRHLGWIAEQSGDEIGAAARFARAAALAPDIGSAIDALLRQARALIAAERYDQAEAVLLTLIDRADGSGATSGSDAVRARVAEARAELATAVARQDRFEDALAAIAAAEQHGANNLAPAARSSLQYEKAWCLRALGRLDDAAAAYRRLLEMAGDDDVGVFALLDLAGIEADAKHLDRAYALLHRLRDRVTSGASDIPDDVREQAVYRLAVCALDLGRNDEAASLFQETVTTFPDGALALSASFFCGEAMFKSGRFKSAVAHYRRVADATPTDPACGPSLLRIAACHAALQRWRKSERVFTEYLDRFADAETWFQAQFGIGWAREQQRRYDDAIKAYRKVTDRHQGPTAARAQFQIGECLFAKKRYDEAVRELLKVDILYAYPEWSAAALFEAGRCFEKLSKPVEARAQFQRVRDKYNDTKWAGMASARLKALAVSPPSGR